MTAERTNAKFHLQSKRPMNDYDREIRAIKPQVPIYLDHCIAYINNKDIPQEVKKYVIKKLKANTVNLFNDVYPKLDQMLKQAAVELSMQKSGIVKQITNTVAKKPEVSVDDIDNIYDALHSDPQAAKPELDEQPVNSEELLPDPQEEHVEDEVTKQKEFDQENF